MPTKAQDDQIRVEDHRRSEPTWDWSAEWDGEHERQIAELETAIADLGTKVAGLQGQLERTRGREKELRRALKDLAGAGWRRRRKLVVRLRERGLV